METRFQSCLNWYVLCTFAIILTVDHASYKYIVKLNSEGSLKLGGTVYTKAYIQSYAFSRNLHVAGKKISFNCGTSWSKNKYKLLCFSTKNNFRRHMFKQCSCDCVDCFKNVFFFVSPLPSSVRVLTHQVMM